MGVKNDLTGLTFGRLTALSWTKVKGKTRWLCSCSCGGAASVDPTKLTTGHTKSCGCILKEVNRERLATHGLSGTPMYGVWLQMLRRCDLPSHKAYKDYGGRGIKVCERWKDFSNFISDMGDPPFPGASIDREDVDGDYSPTNVRWATKGVQARNRRDSRVIEYRGVTKHLNDWAEHLGIHRKTLSSRIFQRGWSVEAAFSKGVKK